MLNLGPLLECADVITDVEIGRRLNAGEEKVGHNEERLQMTGYRLQKKMNRADICLLIDIVISHGVEDGLVWFRIIKNDAWSIVDGKRIGSAQMFFEFMHF